MWPSLKPGDVAGFVPVGEPLSVGDVVLARSKRSWVVHRVLRLQGDQVVLKGDNNAWPDAAVPRAALVGVVGKVRRGGGELPRDAWDVGARPLAGAWVRVARGMAGAARRLFRPGGSAP